MDDVAVLAVWIDGGLAGESARVPLLDAGYTHGLGAFETLLVRSGRPWALERHLGRLGSSLAILGLPAVDDRLVRAAVGAVLVAAGSPFSARLRIQVTGSAVDDPQARLSVVLTDWPRSSPVGDLRVVSSPWLRNERSAISGAKSSSYAENLVALRDARGRGAEEALLANTRGELCEATTSNVFVETGDGRFVTPPLSSGCLPGVMREFILEWSKRGKPEIVEDSIPFADMEKISTIMLSNAVRGLRLVTHLDGRSLEPSDRARQLVASVSNRVENGSEP